MMTGYYTVPVVAMLAKVIEVCVCGGGGGLMPGVIVHMIVAHSDRDADKSDKGVWVGVCGGCGGGVDIRFRVRVDVEVTVHGVISANTEDAHLKT